MRYHQIDWKSWIPEDRAAILFIVRDGRILLIDKKRGLGAGKINAPGGRLEPGETPRQCACRETFEEVGVRPVDVREHGQLNFQFTDGYTLCVNVFAASNWQGEPRETEEAIPRWHFVGSIPYRRMWSDDRLWLPLLLEDKRFFGRFLYRGDDMLGCRLTTLPGHGRPATPSAQA